MVKKLIFKFRKLLVITLCLITVVSIGLNINQYTEIKKDKSRDRQILETNMRNHEASFANIFLFAGKKPILEYIKNLDNLNRVIEEIQQSEAYFETAKSYYVYVNGIPSGFMNTELVITNGFLRVLEEYRIYLESNSKKSFKDIQEVEKVMSDLKIVADWLFRRYNKNDFSVYTDNDFYKQVCPKLKSESIKIYFK